MYIALQILLRTGPHPSVEDRASYGCVGRMERIEHRLRLAVNEASGHPHQEAVLLTFTYSSQTSLKNALIPSSLRDSCNNTNFMSTGTACC